MHSTHPEAKQWFLLGAIIKLPDKNF